MQKDLDVFLGDAVTLFWNRVGLVLGKSTLEADNLQTRTEGFWAEMPHLGE